MIEPTIISKPRTGIYNPDQSNGNSRMAEGLGKAVQLLKPYPCSFNLGEADLRVKDEANNLPGLTLPYVRNSKWLELSEKLVGDEDDDFEEPAGWKGNLLTRAHAELGNLKKAREINKTVLDQHEDDIVALGNSAYLYFKSKDASKAFEVLHSLEELSKRGNFWEQKVRAIGEQGYEYRKFGGAGNLLNSICLLSLALKYPPDDDHMQFILALAYRRCTHIQVYAECPDKINRHDFALEAATRMWNLSHSARNQTLRAAALAQLAYLKYNDESNTKTDMSKCTQMLAQEEWESVVGGHGWRSLVDMTLTTLGDVPSTKVLNIMGQLLKYSRSLADNMKAMELLDRSIKIKPTTRAYHHLGLLYRKKCIEFERNNKPIAGSIFRTSDRRRTYSSPGAIDESVSSVLLTLRRLLKCVHDKVKPFQVNNPFVKIAIEYYGRAVEISQCENRPAVYDLAMMYIQIGMYRESKQCCQNIISGSGSSLMNEYPLHLVNAYNLYGQCCVLEAEAQTNEQLKEFLWEEGEEKLMRSLEVAARLAGKVPELATCVTQLWGAFDNLEKRFKFTGSKASEEKLFKICELIADYRPYLKALDEEVWQAVRQSPEVLKRKVKCFLHYKELNKARACLSLGELKSRDTGSLSWQNSPCARQVLLLSAQQALKSMFQEQKSHSLPGTGDPQIWRQIFHEAFEENPALGTTASAAIKSDKTYKSDVVILDESYDENGDPNPQSTSFNVANILKRIISEIFGLRVTMAHEEVDPGMSVWITLQDNISQSKVVIFVLAGTGRKSLLAETNKVSFKSSSGGKTEQSVIVNQKDDVTSFPLGKTSTEKVDNPGPSGDMGDSYDEQSQMCRLLFQACVVDSANPSSPRHIVSIASDPQAFFRYPGVEHLCLTHQDISELSKLSGANIVESIMKLFKAIVKQKDIKLDDITP